MQGDRTPPAAAAEDLTDLRRDIESMISGAASAAAGRAGRRLAVAARLPRELRDIRWHYAAGTLTGQLAAGHDADEVHRVISALAAIAGGQRATKRGSRGEELESCGYAGGMTVIISGVLPGSDGSTQCAASSWRGKSHKPYGPGGGYNRCTRTGDHAEHLDGFGNTFVLEPKFKVLPRDAGQ
jgi:hypothetical protein